MLAVHELARRVCRTLIRVRQRPNTGWSYRQEIEMRHSGVGSLEMVLEVAEERQLRRVEVATELLCQQRRSEVIAQREALHRQSNLAAGHTRVDVHLKRRVFVSRMDAVRNYFSSYLAAYFISLRRVVSALLMAFGSGISVIGLTFRYAIMAGNVMLICPDAKPAITHCVLSSPGPCFRDAIRTGFRGQGAAITAFTLAIHEARLSI